MKLNKSDIIYEDNHLIAVSKPAGMLVQGDKTGDVCLADLVKQYIKVKYKKPGNVYLGVIHRVDRPVSGLVLFARTSKALSRMNKLFQERDIEKSYLTLVHKKPSILSQELTHYLVKNSEKNITKAYDKPGKNGKKSVLTYNYIATGNHRHLLQVDLHTGRSHQIRAQLGRIGYPISGDVKYGNKKGKGNYIYLHSWKMRFLHPVKKEEVILRCPLPDEMNWNFFKEYA